MVTVGRTQVSTAAFRIVVAAVPLLFLTAPPISLLARSCASVEKPPTLADYRRDAQLRSEGLKSLDQAQAIFLGEALASSETAATFKVIRVWRGEITTPLTLRGPSEIRPDGVKVSTSVIATDFKKGSSYLVEARGASLQEAWPSACGTMLASEAREGIRILDFLTKSYPPKEALGF
jgi:hypothetical protein